MERYAQGESNEDDLDAQITRYVELAEAEGRR